MYRVMIVDDMDIIRLELRRLPVWGGKSGFYIFQEAKSGEDALNKLFEEPADVVITDIKMPKIDGIELLEQIIENKLCSCVVLMSDFSEFAYARQGIKLGAFDYLVKPVTEEDLNSLLERACEFLSNRKREIEHLKRLETALEEKNDENFSREDILHVTGFIQNGDIRAIDAVSHLSGRIISAMDSDVTKAEGALKKLFQKILDELINDNSWLTKFMDNSTLNDTEAYQLNISHARACIKDKIEKITLIFNRLQYGFKDRDITWQACRHVLENIDRNVSLKTVAEHMFMNKTYFSEVFKQKTGIAFIEYLTMVKMERAKVLLSSNCMKTYEVAEKIGFKDVEYFSRVFKKYTGLSPAKFRQN